MNCPCGGSTRRTEKKLVMLDHARRWLPTATPCDLPLRVDVDRCEACGRQRVKPFPNRQTNAGSKA